MWLDLVEGILEEFSEARGSHVEALWSHGLRSDTDVSLKLRKQLRRSLPEVLAARRAYERRPEVRARETARWNEWAWRTGKRTKRAPARPWRDDEPVTPIGG